MSTDYKTEQAEQRYRNDRHSYILFMAAIFIVVDGISESEAIAKATEIAENQSAAADDIRGVLATLPEAQSPVMPTDQALAAQVWAVYHRLLRKYGAQSTWD